MNIAAWTDDLLKDLRYAARQFARNPVFTAVAVASLAIGIGANTAIFSVLNAAMLKSLPVRDPQTLVMLTYTEFTQIRDHSATLASLCVAQAQMNRWQVRISGGAQEEAKGKLVSEE